MAHNNQKRGRNQRRRPGQGNINRAMDSTGPDVKIRGTVAQIYDKYQNLARDAQSSGDRIRAESLLQHAEHYYRLMRALQPKEQATSDSQQVDASSPEKQTGEIAGDEGGAEVKSKAQENAPKLPEKNADISAQTDEAGEGMAAPPPAAKRPAKQARKKRAPRKAITQNDTAPEAPKPSGGEGDKVADNGAESRTMEASSV